MIAKYLNLFNEICYILKHTMTVHGIFVCGINFISVSSDRIIGLMNIEKKTFENLCCLKPFQLGSEVFSKTDKKIAYKSEKDIIIWDEELKMIQTLTEIKRDTLCIEFSPNMKNVIIGCSNTTDNLIIWDLTSNKRIASLNGHIKDVTCLNISVDGLNAISGSRDYTIRLWDLATLQEECVFKNEKSTPFSIKFTNNKNFAVSGGSGNNKVIIWDIKNKNQYAALYGHIQNVCKIIISHGDRFIISANCSEGIRIWNIAEREQFIILGEEMKQANG